VRVNVTNPDTYFREVWNEGETTAASIRASRSKRSITLPHRPDRFTYTVERLEGGCLLYQLAHSHTEGGWIKQGSTTSV